MMIQLVRWCPYEVVYIIYIILYVLYIEREEYTWNDDTAGEMVPL